MASSSNVLDNYLTSTTHNFSVKFNGREEHFKLAIVRSDLKRTKKIRPKKNRIRTEMTTLTNLRGYVDDFDKSQFLLIRKLASHPTFKHGRGFCAMNSRFIPYLVQP
ncbi:hypothetical protein QL285_025927 [Trifolium repens]|nr:hypothetical protein QL285_025927 [Trifolium repens]